MLAGADDVEARVRHASRRSAGDGRRARSRRHRGAVGGGRRAARHARAANAVGDADLTDGCRPPRDRAARRAAAARQGTGVPDVRTLWRRRRAGLGGIMTRATCACRCSPRRCTPISSPKCRRGRPGGRVAHAPRCADNVASIRTNARSCCCGLSLAGLTFRTAIWQRRMKTFARTSTRSRRKACSKRRRATRWRPTSRKACAVWTALHDARDRRPG